MADRTWQIEHRGEFRLALRRATSLPRGNKRDYVSYKTLVRWRFACALRGSARGFWFIDPLGLRPRGLCTVATRATTRRHRTTITWRIYELLHFHSGQDSLHILVLKQGDGIRFSITHILCSYCFMCIGMYGS